MVCSACKNRPTGPDGYVDAPEVQHHVDLNRGPTDQPISPQELKEACEIFGDLHNGGGTLEYRETAPGSGILSGIKFVENSGPPPTLGEIGSPIPSHSVPVGSFGARPFPGLGQNF